MRYDELWCSTLGVALDRNEADLLAVSESREHRGQVKERTRALSEEHGQVRKRLAADAPEVEALVLWRPGEGRMRLREKVRSRSTQEVEVVEHDPFRLGVVREADRLDLTTLDEDQVIYEEHLRASDGVPSERSPEAASEAQLLRLWRCSTETGLGIVN